MQTKKPHRTEVKEWCFRLMNDPEYFEKWRYIDTINYYNNIIEEFEKLYEQTPTTDHFIRAQILNGIKQSKKTWQKLMLFALVYYLNKNLIMTIVIYDI